MAKKPKTDTVDTGALNPVVLHKVVEATQRNEVAYVSQAEGEALVNAGLIEVNTAMPDPNDASKYAARATAAGIAHLGESDEADTDARSKPKFEIDDNIPVPPRGGGGGGTREAVYPFDQLNVGQSFHVPKTADMENPSRTMASAASQATRKWAERDGVETNEDGSPKLNKAGEPMPKWKNTRVFTCRAVGSDDPRGPGVRIYRTA